MRELPSPEFDLAWLWRETTPGDYFKRDVRQTLIDDPDELSHEIVEAFEGQLAAERAAIRAVWHDGDALWEWKNVVPEWVSWRVEGGDPVGQTGLVVVRG